MKILYLSTSYIPYRRADSVHVMHMCQALAKAGHEVNLVYKRSAQFSERAVDPYAFYGVEHTFQLTGVHRPSFKGGGLLYSWGMKRFLKRQIERTDLVFSRDIVGALQAMRYNLPLIYETHVIPADSSHIESIKKILAYPKLVSIVILTEGLLKDFKNKFANDLSGQKLIVAHDAFTPTNETPDFDFNFRGPRLAIGYAGNLYAGKGMEVIGPLAGQLPEYDFNIAGGEEKDIAHWKSTFPYQNLNFLGFVPPSELTGFYQKQDILLLPPLKKSLGLSGNDIANWMSPMKLFEYMNTGKPIIASDLKVLREVLENERNALLVNPDDLDQWIKAISRVINDKELAISLAKNAYQDLLDHHTWKRRVEHILKESKL